MFILLKKLPLELSGRSNPHDYAMPKVIPDKIRTLTGIVKSQFPAIFFKNSSDVNRLEADASALYEGDKNMEKLKNNQININ